MERLKIFLLTHNKLLAVLIFALALRIVGLTHGFPFIFHPDEPSVIRSALGIRFDPNPDHFDWPHLHFYLNFLLYGIFVKFRGLLQLLGLQEIFEYIFPYMWRDPLVFYYISRLFNAVLGALTIVPLYLAGSTLFNKRVGLYTAIAFAVIPFHVWVSQYALIDVPMVFWVSWSLYFCARIYTAKQLKDYVLAGLFIGFAASTKYNGGLLALMVPFIHFLSYKHLHEFNLYKTFKSFVLSGLGAVLGFFIGTPYAFIDYETFLISDSPKGALWQFRNVGSVTFLEHLGQFVATFTTTIIDDLGYTFLIIFVLCAFYIIYKLLTRKNTVYARSLIFVLIMGMFMLYYVSGFSRIRSHYFMPAYPFIALSVGYVTYLLLQFKHRFLSIFVITIIYFIPFVLSAYNSYQLRVPETRLLFYNWLEQGHIQKDDLIVYDTSNMSQIFKKFTFDHLKKKSSFNKFPSGTGYLITTDFEDDLSVYSPVVQFLPQYIPGPAIKVYRLE
ncbi:MAG: glycosyltransferase family 39 protein [Patescibacteria group bacterium]|uniref:Glycosyltransferase family 39 protein n=1 Tax=candidate division WWE3 bacterium TaxID=2053526 RepID=A0A955J239_UNCKA|nr:glycosyltransferase family 39 protein [candidate division WWE3 bacterium]